MPSSSSVSASALFSLWLVPDAPTRETLAADILSLTRISGTAPFVPHITLAGDLPDTPDDIAAIVQRIAAQARPLRLTVAEVAQGDQFFKSLFLRLDRSPQITQLRAHCTGLGETIDQASFDPHISLAYGNMPKEPRQEAMQAARRWVGTSIEVSAISLVQSSSETPIQDWQILHHFPLMGQG
ncbi:2'-5' RNA ligase family protein [Epibacterium ulvae]|uniref:2'-5' RNA ligase family protein n=1 Tax=Epibacterium ulvae TaxID=1156985 RepID=UPI0024919407|nr:2'-5' RNA ligase family protein [Epibacterium ulvae]